MRKLNQTGSVLIFLTLGFALLGTFIGFALDFGRAYLEKARIARLVDGAALAAAKILKGQAGYETAATQAACDSMVMNGAQVTINGTGACVSGSSNLTVTLRFFDATVAGGPPIKNVEVNATEPMPTTFLRFLGFMVPGDYSTVNVAATAQAGPERPVDLMLVLDRSGSMNGVDGAGQTKINSLKTAVNGFLGLSNTFSADDQVGMVSFSTRGCGTSGHDSTTSGTCTPDIPLSATTSSFLTTLQNGVNGLAAGGGTNTMEALQTARAPLVTAFADPTRATTRKAVLLVTDGQPTFMKRSTVAECQSDPKTGATLPAPGNTGGTAGCKLGVTTYCTVAGPACSSPYTTHSGLRGSLTTTDTGLGYVTSGDVPTTYLDIIRCTRAITGCVATGNGAMYEANFIRNCGYGNTACGSGGEHDVVFFAIAIGKPDATNPQNSVDANAKCLLARMSNATDILNAATGVVENITTVCNAPTTTIDGDTHADLTQSWPSCAGPCIDSTQQKGKVYIVDVNGNVSTQLQMIFQEVAALLKLRLVL